MRLKFKISADAFNALAGELQSLYARNENGEYILQVEGAVGRDKLDEFRDTNVDLRKQLEAFGGLKPEEITQIIEDRRKIQEKEWLEAGDVDKIVESRVKTMKQEYDAQVGQLQQSNSTMGRQLEHLTIDNVVRAEATRAGVAPTAVDDVLFRARSVYKLQDGVPTPIGQDGKPIYGKDGSSPMQIGEFVNGLKTAAPHLFGASVGTGATGNQGINGKGNANLSATQKISQGLSNGSKILE